MARCKSTDLIGTAMLDCPPPYTRYEAAEQRAGNAAGSSSCYNALRRQQQKTRPTGHRDTVKIVSGHCCSYCIGGAFAIVLCTLLAVALFPYPLRASCTVQWDFDEPCKFVMQRLRCQILKWTTCSNCGHRGNRCLYSAKSVSRAWYVMFDYGTNYCNIRNLVDSAGFTIDQSFMELTNEAVCTQLGTAVCV